MLNRDKSVILMARQGLICMTNAQTLRKQYSTFIYQSYSWELINKNLVLKFNYTIEPDISFTAQLVVKNVTQERITGIGTNTLDLYVFTLGMSELFSYWKTTASPKIVIKAGYLDEQQLEWWHKLLIKGMGEYFYVNQIEFTAPNFVQLSCDSEKRHSVENSIRIQPSGILVPIGGGKDSSVSLELLKQKHTVVPYVINPTDASLDTIRKAFNQDTTNTIIEVVRTLDPKLFQLNQQGFLNGHVPLSALIAFSSIMTADLFNYEYVAISNERSSNEGNVWYCDSEVNHQYSKTFEFEQDLRNYQKAYLPPTSPKYFSLLRPLFELQIARIFAQYPQYHQVFRSCNRGQKTNVWCGQCSKCLFAYTILFPFLGETALVKIFSNNLFSDLSLLETAQELIGVSENKPFECVGTHEETIVAFYLCIQKYQKDGQPLPQLLEAIKQILDQEKELENRSGKILTAWNSQHLIPTSEIEELIHNQVNN